MLILCSSWPSSLVHLNWMPFVFSDCFCLSFLGWETGIQWTVQLSPACKVIMLCFFYSKSEDLNVPKSETIVMMRCIRLDAADAEQYEYGGYGGPRHVALPGDDLPCAHISPSADQRPGAHRFAQPPDRHHQGEYLWLGSKVFILMELIWGV